MTKVKYITDNFGGKTHNDVLGGLESVDGVRGFEETEGEHSFVGVCSHVVTVSETRAPNLFPHWTLGI